MLLLYSSRAAGHQDLISQYSQLPDAARLTILGRTVFPQNQAPSLVGHARALTQDDPSCSSSGANVLTQHLPLIFYLVSGKVWD